MVCRALTLAGFLLFVGPAPAYAAGGHVPLMTAGILGSIFGTISHAVLGAFSWTIGLASKFVLTTLAALVKLLIPHAWINKGLQIMEWIVAVPDYAGKVTAPGGGQEYGFGGINALRDLFMWLGVAVVPLSLTYATGRAMIGEYEPVGIPVLRVLTVAVVIVSYPYWWSQAAALADQITHAILTLPDVAQGLNKLMQYAVDGVALGGWQLIDLGLMGAIGLELLGLIFLKVVVILLGALLYATGPLMIGLVPTRAGGAIARAWASGVTMLFALGIGWATLFAVGALLINDAGTAGPLIAGNSTFGSLVGGLLLAVAGLASLWLCLKAAKEAGGLMRLQFAGLLAMGHARGNTSGAAASPRARTTGRSLRDYGSRLARAGTAAGGELADALPGGGRLATAGRTAGYVGRRGLVGAAAAGAGYGAKRAAAPAAAVAGRSRAGAVAVRMAKAGTASWSGTGRRGAHSASDRKAPNSSAPRTATGTDSREAGRQSTGTSSSRPTGLRDSGAVTYSRQSEPPQQNVPTGRVRPSAKSQASAGGERTAPQAPDRARRTGTTTTAGPTSTGPGARPVKLPNAVPPAPAPTRPVSSRGSSQPPAAPQPSASRPPVPTPKPPRRPHTQRRKGKP
jgi:hypothetical protein